MIRHGYMVHLNEETDRVLPIAHELQKRKSFTDWEAHIYIQNITDAHISCCNGSLGSDRVLPLDFALGHIQNGPMYSAMVL